MYGRVRGGLYHFIKEAGGGGVRGGLFEWCDVSGVSYGVWKAMHSLGFEHGTSIDVVF